MEAAAKTVELLTQRILPEKPHHLSFHEEWRYHPPPNEIDPLEEWKKNPRLQYLTLVSEADRGLLLTRSDYDMREEPVRPTPREANALATEGGDLDGGYAWAGQCVGLIGAVEPAGEVVRRMAAEAAEGVRRLRGLLPG